MGKTDFISQMVEETMGAYDSSDKPTEELLSIDLEYSSYRKCYIYKGYGQNLEIPRNWGPFANRISKEFILNTADDPYKFLEILSVFLVQEVESVKINICSESMGAVKQAA